MRKTGYLEGSFFVFRSTLCATLVLCLAAVCYTPPAEAFILGELKQIGRAVVGTVKGVGQDVRSSGRAVKNAITPDRSPTQKYRRQYEKRMNDSYREQRRQLRRAERTARDNPTDEKAAKQYEEQVDKAQKRMRQATRRSEEMSRENKRLSKRFGASDQGTSTRMREEHRWLQQKQDARQDARRARAGDFRARQFDRR